MLKIEVFPEDTKVDVRTIRAKDDKPARQIHEQVAYAYLGGKFPVQIKLSLDESQPPYPAGVYTPDCESYIVNSYGGLELRKFGIKITPLETDA